MSGLMGSDRPLVEAYDVALLDLDGVCYVGTRAVPHAAEAVAQARAAGMGVSFVTNNAARPPRTVAEHLQQLGIPATVADVVTSAQAAAAMLAADLQPGAPVLAVGGTGLRIALEEAGLTPVTSAQDAPVAVAQGFSPEIGWAQLTEAVYAIAAGARYVATNLDATLPTERGFAIGNGSLVAAVRHATGVDPVAAGKPEAGIFEHAAARSGAERPLVVGDRLDTDLAGARNAGMPGLHVLTGVNDARDVVLAPAGHRPAYLAADLRDLLTAHPEPQEDDGWWVCQDAAARAEDGTLQVRTGDDVTTMADETRLSLNGWRAVAAAAWAAADAGHPVTACPPIRVDTPR